MKIVIVYEIPDIDPLDTDPLDVAAGLTELDRHGRFEHLEWNHIAPTLLAAEWEDNALRSGLEVMLGE